MVVESPGNFLDSELWDTRCRELKREWDAVQTMAHFRHGACVLRGYHELGQGCPCPLDEEPPGFRAHQRLQIVARGQTQRWDTEDHLTRYLQRLATGGQSSQARTSPQQRLGQFGTR